MSISTVMQAMKKILPKNIVFIKIGSFYHVFGKDAYIISYLFDYKLKNVENNIATCGFPLNSISKVIAKIEDEKINYTLVDKRNNYEEDEKQEYGNLNRYDDIYEKSHKYINLKRRINNIYEALINDIDRDTIKEKIIKIEEIIYD